MRKAAIRTVLFIIIVCGLFAQEVVQVPRRLYIFMEGRAGITPKTARTMGESLLMLISQAARVEVIEPEEELPFPAGDDEKTAFTLEQGGDAWLEVAAGIQSESIVITARLFDIKEETVVFEKSLQKPVRSRQPDDEFWEEVLLDLRDALPPFSEELAVKEKIRRVEEIRIIEHPEGVEVTIKAVPGSRISGLGEDSPIVDASGLLTVEVPQSATYRVRADHWKYYPESKDIFVDHEPVTIDFKQAPGARLGVEILGGFDGFLGAGVFYYFIPNYFHADLRLVNSFFGLMPPFINDRRNDWDSRNLELYLSLGTYINTPNAAVRLALSAGGIIRLHFPEKGKGRLHPVFPYGWTAGLMFEFSILKRLKFFLEWVPEMYLISAGDWASLIYPGSPYESYDNEPWRDHTLLGPFALQLNRVNLGLRYHF